MHDAVNVLLVDDEVRNLDALEAILDDPAYRLLRAVDADLALKLLLENDVAAIVLDIKMPGVSGFELARLIKGTKKFREIPIVFLTAYLVDDQDVLAGYGAGAVDYLTKPVNPKILRHKIAVFADLFRKTRALAELNEKLEARVAERTAELERASRMKDEFLATVSHELRTPLHSMLGWATLLKNEANPEKLRHGLQVIERNARTQERLVTDLLDVSRIISGKLRLSTQMFPLVKAIHGAVEVVRNGAEAKGVRLTVDVDPESGMTVADPERLQQVFWNLLVNAIRYTPAGGSVTVTARREGAAHVVRVTDTGAGIPREHLPHIFERFRQVDSSTTRAHGGLGLGLALVRHLVEAHGGEVGAESQGEGRGATFTVTLPVPAVHVARGSDSLAQGSPEGEGDGGAEAPPGDSPHTGSELAGVRVLVVDDDADSLDLLRVVLEDAGAEVACAASGREALATIDAPTTFDVIVSDIGMPEMDGHALVQRLRSERGYARPIVALTAYARVEDEDRAKSAGYDEHLAKPVDAAKLIERIKAFARAGRGANARSSPPGTGGGAQGSGSRACW